MSSSQNNSAITISKKNIDKESSCYVGKSRGELEALFSAYIVKANNSIDLKNRMKNIGYAIELEEKHLKRMKSNPGCKATIIGLLRVLGEGHRNQELITEAISYFLRAIELSKCPYPPHLQRIVLLEQYDCHDALSNMYCNSYDIKLADHHSKEAFHLGEKAYSGENLAGNETEYVKGISSRAYYFCKIGNTPKGVELYEKAYDCLTSVLDEENEEVQKVVESLVEAYTNGRNLIKATDLLNRTLAKFRSHGKASGIVFATRYGPPYRTLRF
jgi:tetratricopeptide (TPR) repeat protein